MFAQFVHCCLGGARGPYTKHTYYFFFFFFSEAGFLCLEKPKINKKGVGVGMDKTGQAA